MNDTPDNARIQAILASGIKIPPLPAVLLQLQALLADADTGSADMARVIQQDGSLSGALYRVVGSPVFGLRRKVETLEQAVSLLGIPPTLAILRGLALRNSLGDETAKPALEILWQRSGRIAQLALVATRVLRPRGITPDQAYTLGMFHDCGLALLAKRFPAYAQALMQSAWPDVQALDQTHKTDHALLGETVARNWQLPDLISKAIRHHHDVTTPADAGEAVSRLVAVLNLACHLYRQARGEDDGEWQGLWREASMAGLELGEPGLADLEAQIREILPQV